MSLGETLREWVAQFLESMERRNYSLHSRKTYGCDLLLFARWVGEQPNLEAPGELTATVLEQYQLHLMLRTSITYRYSQPRTMTAATRNRHLAELRSFFRYLKKTCKLLSNPSLELENARQTKKLPKNILTVPEVARLLQTVPKTTASGLRDLAALELLYGTGVRRGELLGIALTDLRLSEGFVHILGKGNKERVVPMGKAAHKAVLRYLREGRPQLLRGNTSALLVSSFHGGPVLQKELLKAIRSYAKEAGIRKAIGFHLFRHTCATHMLRGGADLRSIQTLLGHANLNTTAIYTRVEIADLQKTLQRCHPREKDAPSP